MARISLLALIHLDIFGHLGKQDDHILTPPSTGRDLFSPRASFRASLWLICSDWITCPLPRTHLSQGYGNVDWVSVNHHLPLELWMRVGLAS